MPTLKVIDLITADNGCRFAPAGRMASIIIDVTHEHGGCEPKDLSDRGFSRDEISSHWHMAESLASVELKLMSAV